ncbi:MAG: hypothetical protein DELT_00331 [Desulfovibrio sp.]
MITSFFDGRVRIRHAALKDETAMTTVLALVAEQEGVVNVVPNTRTGSLLVEYDPEKISRETLLEAGMTLEKHLPVPKKATARECVFTGFSRLPKLSPLEESLLLGGLYAATAATGFAGKRLHVALGVTFAILAGLHVYERRRCLK